MHKPAQGSESGAIEIAGPFHSLGGRMAVRDCQELMAYPFFSLAKAKRVEPIHYSKSRVEICVEGTPQHGIATIWDADILLWAASLLREAKDHGLPTSRRLIVPPYEILKFADRGTSAGDYERLRSALNRLQSTTIRTSIRQKHARRLHTFSWISEWKERICQERSEGLELMLSDWFYEGIGRPENVLTIDQRYFQLTGGLQRWLYRLVRKHAGRQAHGWRFEFAHLHAKSGVLIRFSDFAVHLRKIALAQSLPSYRMSVERSKSGTETLRFQHFSAIDSRSQIRALTARFKAGRNL